MKNHIKNLSLLLAVLAIGAQPLVAEEEKGAQVQLEQPSQIQKRLGSQAVAALREGYEKGDYNQFLKELDDSYLKAKDANQLTQLIEMREGPAADWEKWEDQARRLQEQKGKELIAAVEDDTDSLFKEKVLSAGASLTSESQDEALFRIATLRQMAPGMGANEDENKLIDLDLEYEYKSLHVSMPGKLSSDQREKQMVLRMEKAQKMKDLSASFTDASLKRAVDLCTENLDSRLAQIWDTMDLNGFVQGGERPSNAAEEKVVSILNQYQEKFSELAKQFAAEHN